MLALVIDMKRTLIALFALFALGTVVLASSLPQNGSIVVTNDNGVQVGTGNISHGKLSLNLTTPTTGLVTITVTNGQGETESYQAMIGASNTITVVHDSQFQDLPAFAKSSGIDSVDVTETPDSAENHASQTGQTAKQDNATTPEQETENSQASDHSQGNGQVSNDSSPDSNSSASGSDSSTETEHQGTSGDDQVKVGINLGSNSGSTSGTSGDSSGDSSSSKDD